MFIVKDSDNSRYYYSGDDEIRNADNTDKLVPILEKRKYAYEFKTIEDALEVVNKFPSYDLMVEEVRYD